MERVYWPLATLTAEQNVSEHHHSRQQSFIDNLNSTSAGVTNTYSTKERCTASAHCAAFTYNAALIGGLLSCLHVIHQAFCAPWFRQ